MGPFLPVGPTVGETQHSPSMKLNLFILFFKYHGMGVGSKLQSNPPKCEEEPLQVWEEWPHTQQLQLNPNLPSD